MPTVTEIMSQAERRQCDARSGRKSDDMPQSIASALLAEIKKRMESPAKPPETLEEKRQACQAECDSYNRERGTLPGDHCDKCQDKGRILKPSYEKLYNDFVPTAFDCDCMAARLAKQRLLSSGVGPMLMKCTLDNFDTSKGSWQGQMQSEAARFVTVAHQGHWFYIGGDAGSGKSHLCAGIMQELLALNMACTWMDWVDDSTRAINGWKSDYDSALEPWRKAPVLVIDDFLKPIKTSRTNTPAPEALRLAYSIINYRYNNPGLVTIISSEHTLGNLMDFDQAMASRIEHRCGNFVLDNDNCGQRNVRHLYSFQAAFVNESLEGV